MLLAGPGPSPDCAAHPTNVPLDLDLDGQPDTVRVSDFDGDGSLEMDDVQDAVESLTDPGDKTVCVSAGSYEPPAQPGDRPGRVRALVELGSHTLLQCEAGAALRGPDGIGLDDAFAVIANVDHAQGNDAIVVRGCEIDGGAPDSYSGTVVTTSRMGVYFRRTRNSRVEGCFVHHTLHSGLYSSNSQGDQFTDNVIEDVGGYGNIGPMSSRFRYPGIYVYAFDGGVAEDFVAARNTLRRVAGGLSSRADADNAQTDVVRNALWEDNLIETTGFSTGGGGLGPGGNSKCIVVRGVDTILVRRNECRDSGGVHVHHAGSWRYAGDDDANANVVIEDLDVIDVNASVGVLVGAHNDQVTLRNVRVEHTRGADGVYLPLRCMRVETPLRGGLFENVELRHCGAEGLQGGSVAPSGAQPGEELTFRRVTVEHVDMADPVDGIPRPGVHFRGAHAGLELDTVVSSFASGSEIQFDRSLTDSTLIDVQVDSVDPGWLGAFSEATAPSCDAAADRRWIVVSDAQDEGDCDFSPGSTGAASARCKCVSGAWSVLGSGVAQPGILFDDQDAPSVGVLLQDLTVANAQESPGVELRGQVSGITISNLTGIDDSPATPRPQRSALRLQDAGVSVTLEDVQCVDTEPGAPCVEYEYADPEDWDEDGAPNASDNCAEAPNPDQSDLDGDGAGDVCDEDMDGDGLANVHETGTGVFVSATDTGTDPANPDTDGDRYPDGREVEEGMDPHTFNPAPAPLPPWAPACLVGLILATGLRRLASGAPPGC